MFLHFSISIKSLFVDKINIFSKCDNISRIEYFEKESKYFLGKQGFWEAASCNKIDKQEELNSKNNKYLQITLYYYTYCY